MMHVFVTIVLFCAPIEKEGTNSAGNYFFREGFFGLGSKTSPPCPGPMTRDSFSYKREREEGELCITPTHERSRDDDFVTCRRTDAVTTDIVIFQFYL